MGVWDMYCSFCAGPLGSVRISWIHDLKTGFKGKEWPPKDGEWINPRGYPVPNKPIEEIVRITDEDDKFWEDTVCVGPMFKPTWVSRPCVGGSYGDLEIDDSSDWQDETEEPYNLIHIGCLSLLCRRLDITPEEWWLSFYGPESKYQDKWTAGENHNMLKTGFRYYGMEGRNGQDFSFCHKIEKDEDNEENWWDPDTYEECNWLFAAPSTFPRVPDIPPPLEESSASSPTPNQSASLRVLFTPDLLYSILDFAVPYISQNIIAGQLGRQSDIDDSPTVLVSLKTMLSLLRVNKRIYKFIIQGRQDLFFRLVWQFGWMLPACPMDWKSWNAINDPLPPLNGIPFSAIPGDYDPNRATGLSNAKDWRAYLITCLRQDDPHVQNRYRFHRMHVQFARGKKDKLKDGTERTWYICGKMGLGTALECPEPYKWEKPMWLEDKGDSGDDDEDD